MRLFGALAVLVTGTGAWASDAKRGPNHLVMVCLNPSGNAATILQGEGAATQLLKQAGIRLEWRGTVSNCVAGSDLVITLSHATPQELHPGALAYAMPFERTHIVLFYDRVLNTVGPNTVPVLLGHVLAHEIVHILQGTTVHSASGIMKEHWNNQDYADMRLGRLKFTQDDTDLIDQGLKWRTAMSVQPQYHK